MQRSGFVVSPTKCARWPTHWAASPLIVLTTISNRRLKLDSQKQAYAAPQLKKIYSAPRLAKHGLVVQLTGSAPLYPASYNGNNNDRPPAISAPVNPDGGQAVWQDPNAQQQQERQQQQEQQPATDKGDKGGQQQQQEQQPATDKGDKGGQ